MSGGSWDYLCFKVDEAADRLQESRCEHRRAFGLHLSKVAHALHEIEWVDSCDKSPPADLIAIAEVLERGDVMEVLVRDAREVSSKLELLLAGHEPKKGEK